MHVSHYFIDRIALEPRDEKDARVRPPRKHTVVVVRAVHRHDRALYQVEKTCRNQVELLFGILHRRILRCGVFDSLEEMDDAIIGILEHWNNEEKHPFNWTFKGYRKNKKAT